MSINISMSTDNKIYKGISIVDCPFNDAIIECIYVINANSETGSHFDNYTRPLMSEKIRLNIINELKEKLKK